MDERRACQGLVCEGLLLLLRDAMRVLPDCQIGLVLKHVLRAELLLVLANNPDNRVRTALIKVNHFLVQYIPYIETHTFIKIRSENEMFHQYLVIFDRWYKLIYNALVMKKLINL